MNRSLVLTITGAVLVGCSGPPVQALLINRSYLGNDWPLSVESGTLRCEGAGAIVFTAPDGTDYGVNALAAQYADIAPIWAADPTGQFAKRDIGPLVNEGQRLCQR